MTTIALIYWILGSIWAIGLHVWAEKKYGYFKGLPTLQKKIVRGLIGYLFNATLWPIMVPNVLLRLKKGKQISLTHLF